MVAQVVAVQKAPQKWARVAGVPPTLLTWPGLQQVMQHLDVPLEVNGAGDVLTVGIAAVAGAGTGAGAPGLLVLGEQDRPEADGDVLRVHTVEIVEGGHQAEVVQEPCQRGLGDKVASTGMSSDATPLSHNLPKQSRGESPQGTWLRMVPGAKSHSECRGGNKCLNIRGMWRPVPPTRLEKFLGGS